MRFAAKIRGIADRLGTSVRQIAQSARINEQTLHSAIRRDTELSATDMLKVARALRISVEWLIDSEQGFEQLAGNPPTLWPSRSAEIPDKRREAEAYERGRRKAQQARQQVRKEKPRRTGEVK